MVTFLPSSVSLNSYVPIPSLTSTGTGSSTPGIVIRTVPSSGLPSSSVKLMVTMLVPLIVVFSAVTVMLIPIASTSSILSVSSPSLY